MQTDATSQNIVGPNNIGIRWELLALVDTFKLKQLRYFGLNNSPFCPKLFLYLFIGPLTFFPQINSLYLTRLRGKSFPREGQSAVPPRDLTIFWCIYSRFSVFCLNVSCFLKLFAQLSLISYVYYNPERRKTRYDCLFFEKNITMRVCRRFHEANIVGVPCTRRNIVALRFAGHRTMEMSGTCCVKSLTGFQLNATSAYKCQHCCGSMQTDATSLNIAGPQQCCVLLANKVVSVCMGLNATKDNSYTTFKALWFTHLFSAT